MAFDITKGTGREDAVAASAQLDLGGRTAELPYVSASLGPGGLDVKNLLQSVGAVAFDPGYTNTGSARSEITFIDGDAGQLLYRGYRIEELAERSNFLEVCFLLIFGELPKDGELASFVERVSGNTRLPEGFSSFFNAFKSDAHPMAMLSAAVSAMSTFHQDVWDPTDDEQVDAASAVMLGQFPTIVASILRHQRGEGIAEPDPEVPYVQDFLRMALGDGLGERADGALARAVDVLLVLHADHEQNCSTSTVRLVGSARSTLFASVTAGINALAGPLHGGANSAVIEMLDEVHASGIGVRSFVERVKKREGGIRLMGFGHRVYRNYDPRATIVKDIADQVLSTLGVTDPRLELAKQLEEAALNDPYFVERRLYPNVDFYTGVIYSALGFPASMFTTLFALGRIGGWLAQWREMTHDPAFKLGRPRQVYTGPLERDYVPIVER